MPGEEGVFGAFARIASTVLGGAPDGAKHAWSAIAPWINELTRSATTKWLPFLVHGIPCEVVEHQRTCTGAAIAACGVCVRPVCIHHSFVSKSGEAVCFPCAIRAKGAYTAPEPASEPRSSGIPRPGKAPPPPPAGQPPPIPGELLVAARRVLGVKKDTPWDEVERLYKKLLKKHHPDRHQGPLDKQRAEAKFKEVRAAFDLLTKAREQKAA